MASTGDDASPPPDAARLLELSDERDQWEHLRDAAYRDGWQAGHDAGQREGYRRAAADWKVTVSNAGWRGPGPAHAELDRRRYPRRPAVMAAAAARRPVRGMAAAVRA